jgi:membrane protease YdiL (CAAX protease family)
MRDKMVAYELDEPLTNTVAEPLDAPSERRHHTYLWVALAVWSLGALSTHWIGVWAGIGGAAVSLGLWGLLFDDRLTADIRRPNLKLIAIGLIAGAVMLVGTYLGYRTIMWGIPQLHGATGELYRFFAALPRHLVPLAVPVIILSEEVVWRGRVQALFLERMPPVPAAVVTAALYALAHAAIGSPLLVGVAFVCGLFWGTLRGATGSIIPGLIAHVIWDVCVMVMFPLTPPT